jgi:hypothetical protein
MTNKQDNDTRPATTDSTGKSSLGHLVRVVVMCLSCGFIYPNAMTESDDIVDHDICKEAKTKKE